MPDSVRVTVRNAKGDVISTTREGSERSTDGRPPGAFRWNSFRVVSPRPKPRCAVIVYTEEAKWLIAPLLARGVRVIPQGGATCREAWHRGAALAEDCDHLLFVDAAAGLDADTMGAMLDALDDRGIGCVYPAVGATSHVELTSVSMAREGSGAVAVRAPIYRDLGGFDGMFSGAPHAASDLGMRTAENRYFNCAVGRQEHPVAPPTGDAEAFAAKWAEKWGSRRADFFTACPHVDCSFIIPVYNAEEYIADAVASAFAQEQVEVEVVVVNDGSTDGTFAKLKELRAQHRKRLVVLSQPNGGPSAARNLAVERATGEVLIYLDADDVAPPMRARWSLDALADADLVYGLVQVFEEGQTAEQAVDIGTIGEITRETVGHAGGFRGGASACRRELHDELGVWWDEEMNGAEDYDLCLAALAAGARVEAMERVMLFRRNVGDSLRHRVDFDLLKRWARLKHRAGLEARFGADLFPDNDDARLPGERNEALQLARERSAPAVTNVVHHTATVSGDEGICSGYPGPAVPPAPGEPLRVLFHTFAARREGQECFADYLALGMPEGAVEWVFTVEQPHGPESGHLLREHGEVRLLQSDPEQMRWEFLRALLDFRPHVVHSSCSNGSRLAREFGLPVVVTVHGIIGGGWYGAEYGVLAAGVSPAASEGSSCIILSGVAPLEYVEKAKREIGTFVWLGRLDSDRKPEVFLDALMQVPDAKAVIIGAAYRRTFDCAAAIEQRGLSDRVRYLGALPPEEARQRAASCDALATTCDESFGLSTAELMTAGVRPVVVEGPGYQTTMAGRHGVVVPATAEGFVAGLRKALDDPLSEGDRRSMAAAAAEEYSHERMALTYLAAYRRVVIPRTDVVILAHDQLELTRDCVSHVIAHTHYPHRLVLVDNGSEEEPVLDYFHTVRDALGEDRCVVVESKVNTGCPGGRQLAYEVLDSPYFFWLDNDMLVPEGWLAPLVNALIERPNVGAISPWSNVYPETWRGTQPTERNFSASNALFRAEAVAAAAEVPGHVHTQPFVDLSGRADTDLLYRVIEAGYALWMDCTVELLHLGGPLRDGMAQGMTRRHGDTQGMVAGNSAFQAKWASWGVRR